VRVLAHILGLDGPSYWANFWSGFGSCLSEFALLGGLFAFYRRHTCHVDSPRFCWRLGVHQVVGTPYRACKKHHPAVPDKVTAEHIQAAHNDAQKGASDAADR
jgi:hypothetical protein